MLLRIEIKMTNIDIAFSVAVDSGTTVKESRTLSAEACVDIKFDLVPGKSEADPHIVAVQPNTEVNFLLIKSSLYSTAAGEIKYGIKGSDNESKISLDQPHVYMGAGAVSVLGGIPEVLTFTNSYPAAAESPAADPSGADSSETDPPEADKPDEAAIENPVASIHIIVGRGVKPAESSGTDGGN